MNMISVWWLLLVVPASAFVGMLLSALLVASRDRKDDDE